jgi:hypothetical protein
VNVIVKQVRSSIGPYNFFQVNIKVSDIEYMGYLEFRGQEIFNKPEFHGTFCMFQNRKDHNGKESLI